MKAELRDWCHTIARSGLVVCSSGNMSVRLDDSDDRFLITGSGTWFEDISIGNISECSITTRKVYNGVKPSTEKLIHSYILESCSEVNVVLHFQSPYATAIACQSMTPETDTKIFNVIPEVPYHIGKISVINYYIPGSPALANVVHDEMKISNLVVMRNHGIVVVGESFNQVYQRAMFFEFACRILINNGDRAISISSDNVEKLNKLKEKRKTA